MTASMGVTNKSNNDVQQALITSSDEAPSVQSMTEGVNLLQDSDEVRALIDTNKVLEFGNAWIDFFSLFLQDLLQ